jgi:hypothetical protein
VFGLHSFIKVLGHHRKQLQFELPAIDVPGQHSNRVLAEAAKEHSLSVDTIAVKVRKEFAAREEGEGRKEGRRQSLNCEGRSR